MSNRAYAERLAHALTGTGLCETVNFEHGVNNVSVLLRVLKDAEPRWLEMVKKIRYAERALKVDDNADAFYAHICKHYFLKGDALVYGWNVSISSPQLTNSLDVVIRVVKGGLALENRPNAGKEIDEMPLSGMEGVQDRNKPKPGSKKGVYAAGTNPTR